MRCQHVSKDLINGVCALSPFLPPSLSFSHSLSPYPPFSLFPASLSPSIFLSLSLSFPLSPSFSSPCSSLSLSLSPSLSLSLSPSLPAPGPGAQGRSIRTQTFPRKSQHQHRSTKTAPINSHSDVCVHQSFLVWGGRCAGRRRGSFRNNKARNRETVEQAEENTRH